MTTFWSIFLTLIIGLLGGLIGWYIRRQRTQELSEELDSLQAQNIRLMQNHDAINSRCESLNSSYNSLSDTYKRLGNDHNSLQIEFSELKAEKNAFVPEDNSGLHAQISDLESQLATLRSEYTDYRAQAVQRIQAADEQVSLLRAQYDMMLDNYIKQGQQIKNLNNDTTSTQVLETSRAEKRADEAKIRALEIELSSVNAEFADYKNGDKGRNQQLAEQYHLMVNKYVQQGNQLKSMADEVKEWQSHYESLMLKKNNQDTQILELDEMRAKLENDVVLLRGQFDGQQKRNLTLQGEMAILTHRYKVLEGEKAQIHQAFVSSNTALETKAAETAKSNWEQRCYELESRHSSLIRRFQDLDLNNQKMEKTITTLNGEILLQRRRANPDDLKRIEGVGPKIEELLNEAGIYKFDQLATTSVDRIRAILDKAGARFRMHDPESWAAQADMAHKGEWTKLKEYQDYLIGGKRQEQPFVAMASR
jgi:predicted flap endonuclease-1-like 5' DNA nuclease/transcriptional antiterminator Rof (Rho-off)